MKHKVDWKRNFFAEPSVDNKVELQVTTEELLWSVCSSQVLNTRGTYCCHVFERRTVSLAI